MKAIYGKLKVPNISTSHVWSVDKIKKIASSGDLYKQALHHTPSNYCKHSPLSGAWSARRTLPKHRNHILQSPVRIQPHLLLAIQLLHLRVFLQLLLSLTKSDLFPVGSTLNILCCRFTILSGFHNRQCCIVF